MCVCKICGSSGKQGDVFLIQSFKSLEDAICSKCIQPERLSERTPETEKR